jgi:putative alpha-1,2-mannosidase
LEYCYDDWTIYQTALAVGNKEVADEYYMRALNYRNIYDGELGFARPKYRDGSFKEEFDVLQTHGEGLSRVTRGISRSMCHTMSWE